MKTNKLFIAALASAMLVGCADEELVSVNNGNAQGLKGKLVDAGVLAMERSTSTETRAYSPTGGFVWMPTALNDDGSLTAERKNQKVGFAWTGRNVKEPEYSAAPALNANVYTNYMYEHVGWLDVKATLPEILECTTNKLANGAYITGEGTPEADFTGELNKSTFATERYTKYYATASTGKYEKTGHKESSGELQLSKGVFATENASVFEGEYLVYYPYTDAFTKGEILASMPISYDIKAQYKGTAVDQDKYAAASESAFALGYVEHYDGGNTSAKLEAKTLNGFAIVNLTNYGTTGATPKNVKSVILYSQSTGFIYSQELNAAACVAALKNGNLGNGTDLYTGESKKKNVVYANLTDGTNNYITVPAGVDQDNEKLVVALPVFPQTISDLQIILVNQDDKTYTYSVNEAVTFAPNAAEIWTINLHGKTFVNEYMVVDEPTMWSAWEKIRSNGEANLTKGNKIKMLNDITLTGVDTGAGIYNSWFFDKNITITSDPSCNATLTIAQENAMSIKGSRLASTEGEAVLTVDVPVVVKGMDCCEKQVAALVVGNKADSDGKVVFNKDVTNNGTLVLNNNAAKAQTIEFKGTLTNAYDQWAVAKGKTAGAAEIYMLGQVEGTTLNIAKLVNTNGKVVSAATTINIDQIFAANEVEYKVPADLHPVVEGEKRTNTNTIAELVNDAKIYIETKTVVNVTTDLKNNAAGVIYINGGGYSTYDGRLDVKGTSANKGVMDNTGVVNFTKSSMDNDGLFIDRQSGQVGGKKVDNGSSATGATKAHEGVTYTTDLPNAGIYVAQVETDERMMVVLGDAVVEPSTNIIEVLSMDEDEYNLETYKKNFEDKDVIINADKAIKFTSWKTVNSVKTSTASSFGHCVKVLADNTLNLERGTLSTVKNINVEKDGILNVNYNNVTTNKTSLTVGNNLQINGYVLNEVTAFVVNNDLIVKNNGGTDYGKFYSAKVGNVFSKFTVKGNVLVNGTFDSDGTENIVEGNFTQDGGITTFAYQTTTLIKGTFNCNGGKFEREGLNGSTAYRATVNVGTLGATDGTTDSAWPTEI